MDTVDGALSAYPFPCRESEQKMIQEPRASRYYLYCVIPGIGKRQFGKIGIGGPDDEVYTIEHKDISVVVSNPAKNQFERSEENILAHQRVVQHVFDEHVGVPLPFSTTAGSEMDVQQFLEERYTEFKEKLGSLNEDAAEPGANDTAARELVDEVLAQSAASAVRIRQLNEEISQLRSMRYEKAMEAAADSIMKRLSTQLSGTLNSLNQKVETLQEKITFIISTQENMYRMKAEPNLGGDQLSQLPSVDAGIRALREELERLNRRGLEEMLTPHAKTGS